ncbi:hypothetical protein [Bradyrhizobium sp.]|uniref:hypothetical protein n=1 Tax=Bradyrhizobium sp. TaxID=376 RepID=UPI003C5213A8
MTVYIPPLGTTDLKAIIRSLMQLASGRSNATGTVTLAANATSTLVNDQNCAAGSAITLTAMTADAAAAQASLPGIFVTASNGSFVINHASNAQTDRQFTYAIHG